MEVGLAFMLFLLAPALTVDAGIIYMRATCRDKMTVYFDGIAQNSTPVEGLKNWQTVSEFTIPDGTSEVGIRCHHSGNKPGILAWLSNGLVTGPDWQCSSVSFDTDMFCPEIIPGTPQTIAFESLFFTRPRKAEWIWWSDFDSSQLTPAGYAYCKSSLSEPVSMADFCPDGFIFDAGADFCFKIGSSAGVTWGEAEYLCQTLGRDIHLASLDTRERMDFLRKFLSPAHYLIGLIEMEEGQWFWMANGDRLSTRSSWWMRGQPDNHHNENRGELIVSLDRSSHTKQNVMDLNDVGCRTSRTRYLCERRLQ